MSIRSKLLITVLLLSLGALPGTAAAQGAGANVNFLTPVGLQTLNLGYLESNSNFRFGQTGFDEFAIETNTSSLVYAWRFGLFDRLAVTGVNLSYLDISARANLGTDRDSGRPRFAKIRGFGDPRAFLRVGLLGTPALPADAWREYEQGFQLSTEVGLRFPVGDYSPRRILNPGFNRYALDLAFPLVIPLDRAQRRTFIEITPQVAWFGDNTEAPLGVSRLSQDPLFLGELHLSHHLGGRWWFAMGVQYQSGGETAWDGVPRDNAIDQWFGEAGVGLIINRHFNLSLGYGRIFAADNDAEGEAWRVRLGMIL